MAEYGESLSQREKEVLESIATGATNRQTAVALSVSVNTVKVHLRNIYTKLGVESRTEATLVAIRDGLISLPADESGAELTVPEAPPAQEALPTATAEAETTRIQAKSVPPLAWPKRLALIGSLLLVVLATALTWPRSQTVAIPQGPDTDSALNGGHDGGLSSTSTDWHALAPMTTARSRFALVAYPNDVLFAIGGETNGGVIDTVERYNPVADQWTLLTTNKPTRVSNIGAVAIDEWIYVPGGLTAEGKPTAVVEAYNPTDGTWRQAAPLPRPLHAYALAAYRGRLYLFGGRDDRSYVNTTYIYNPEKDQWEEGKTMATRRAYAAAASLGPHVFIIGGYDGQREQSTCEVYDTEQDTWDTCEPLIQGRGGLGLVQVANQLYAVGGGWSNYLGFSEKYNPETTGWTPFETPVSRQWRNLAAASSLSKFYVAGGWNGEYLNGVWEYVVLGWQIYVPAVQP
jgi:DNA-binding CsgD family transcriptional regulator/N-acetylneuraminic acid mutarotase